MSTVATLRCFFCEEMLDMLSRFEKEFCMLDVVDVDSVVGGVV